MARRPFLQMYDVLNNDTVLDSMMLDLRLVDEPGENMIFTFDIREEFRKLDYAPMIRMTEISTIEAAWNDNNSGIYTLRFAVEIFTPSIDDGFNLGNYILEKYKDEHNGICYSQNLQYDDRTELYNTFMKFKIFINKGEI